jgi:pantoate--beta-alanine ligase
MQVINTVAEMREWTAQHFDKPVAAVYTMGALHDGHLELVRQAKHHVAAHSGKHPYVIASIFVNPTQFTNAEDLDKYPRTLEHDLEMLSSVGVDAVFVPSVEQMYPTGNANTITIEPGPLGDELEGVGRPGHFRGVLTVVNKLLNITAPNYAMFGEKDFQQLTLIKAMVAELNLAVEIVGVPTVRDSDGLAKSSRNRRLTDSSRVLAARIPEALVEVKESVALGNSVDIAINTAMEKLSQSPEISVEYLTVTDEYMHNAPVTGRGRVLIAANVEGVRLIDNMAIEIKGA